MKRFEYKEVETHNATCSQEKLNELGLEGWELVSVVILKVTSYFYFKREITDPL